MTAEQKPGDYDQQPNKPADDAHDEAADGGGQSPAPGDSAADEPAETSEERDIIDLEPLVESGPAKVNEGDPLEHPPKMQDLDVCPNCGAPLVGETTVVCMRCGFDLRALKPIETSAVAPAEEDEPFETDEPLAQESRLRVSISWTVAGVAIVLLLAGLLSGIRALFPGVEPVMVGEGEQARAIIPWSARWTGTLKFLVTTLIWFGCAIAALALFSRLVERRFGPLSAASAHLLAIVTTMQLVRYWGVPMRSLEWTLETATALIVFLGLSLTLLNFTRRDVITYALITALVFLCLFFGSHVITWAMA